MYDRIDFAIPVGKEGDCYDRYLVRVRGIAPVEPDHPAVCGLARERDPGPVRSDDYRVSPPPREKMKAGMEELIHHFKLFTEGFHLPAGEVYSAVEAPKGEFGIYMISDGANKPFRMKIRAPSFVHLQGLEKLIRGHLIPDAVAVIGSIDIVFGEVDR